MTGLSLGADGLGGWGLDSLEDDDEEAEAVDEKHEEEEDEFKPDSR